MRDLRVAGTESEESRTENAGVQLHGPMLPNAPMWRASRPTFELVDGVTGTTTSGGTRVVTVWAGVDVARNTTTGNSPPVDRITCWTA